MGMAELQLRPQRAFQTLYRDHAHWLEGWLSRQVRSRCDAADLMQDTFVRIIGRDSLASIESARGYLRTVAHGLLLNHRRRKRLERLYLDALACLPELTTAAPEVSAIALDTLIEIDSKLDGLPPKARQAFLLSKLEGLDHAQIAARLDVSISSVRKYLFAAVRSCIACQ